MTVAHASTALPSASSSAVVVSEIVVGLVVVTGLISPGAVAG